MCVCIYLVWFYNDWRCSLIYRIIFSHNFLLLLHFCINPSTSNIYLYLHFMCFFLFLFFVFCPWVKFVANYWKLSSFILLTLWRIIRIHSFFWKSSRMSVLIFSIFFMFLSGIQWKFEIKHDILNHTFQLRTNLLKLIFKIYDTNLLKKNKSQCTKFTFVNFLYKKSKSPLSFFFFNYIITIFFLL